MKLFITFGSWGEIAPILEIALQLQDRGEDVCFLTTPDWSPRVRAYGVTCHDLPTVRKHADTLDDFMRAHLVGRIRLIYETIEAIKPSHLISAFYCFPAHAYAERKGIPFVATTTSPYYFTETEMVPSFEACMDEYMELRADLKLENEHSGNFTLAGVYPWYLHEDVGCIPVGFPELRPLMPLSKEVAKFIEKPYGVVTRGTLVGRGELDRMVNAIKAHGLRCLYLGPHESKADLSVFLDNHKEAVKYAQLSITHAGIGTTVDCMHGPMVVSPVGYDQFYNAKRLIDLKCAVGVKDSYIKAIEEAKKPRSFLPNYFNLDHFIALYEHTPSNPRRPAANARERAQIH